MNRHYTAEEYFRTLKRLRSCFPDCAITTDIMIGFPGESDEAFEESIDFVRQCEFAKLHVFPYSARPGTAAAGFAEQIDKSKKRERMRRMLSLAEEMNRLFLLRQCGKLTRVLLEEPCPMGGMQGYAPNYARIAVPEAGQELRGEIIDVRVRAVKGDYCTGELAH
jgi:threonylcarbamoyladenosine tRNA methylthiotransferase MtaB